MITARPACGSPQQQLAQLAFEAFDLAQRLVDLVLEVGAFVLGGVLEQLAGDGEVTLPGAERLLGGDDRFELAVPARHGPQQVEVARRIGVGEARLELAELVGERRTVDLSCMTLIEAIRGSPARRADAAAGAARSP